MNAVLHMLAHTCATRRLGGCASLGGKDFFCKQSGSVASILYTFLFWVDRLAVFLITDSLGTDLDEETEGWVDGAERLLEYQSLLS